jgi:hypothetical protein
MAAARKKKTDAPTEIMGWWFAASDELPHGDGRKVVIGETLTVDGEIVPCEHGLHASVDPFDALQYAPGAILYRVRLSDAIVAHDKDKRVASERTAIAKRDSTQMLWAFARKEALSVIHLWDAPTIVREYLETGDESKRAAAGDAAGDAWAAAGAAGAAGAAAGAAWGAAAGDAAGAAWAAARAAGAAAGAAARAAGAAAGAARAAARAAGDAAGAAARKLLNEMVTQLFEGEE